MQSVNRLGIRVAIITLILVLVIYGIYRGVQVLWLSPNISPNQTSQAPLSSEEEAADSDTDGLSNLLENIYKTDPQKADTDGDGTLDGAEVTVGRDPTVTGPNDILADTAKAKVVVNTVTFTGQYLASLPPNLPQEEILDKARVEAFIAENKGVLLPPIDSSLIKTTSAIGKEAIAKYLDSISSAHNPALTTVTSADIEAAFRAYHANPQESKDLRAIQDTLLKNISALQAVAAPEEVKELHARLVAASTSLAQNVHLLLGETQDLIGGLIGAKNIEDLGPVFAKIGGDMATLQKKYNIP